MLAMLIVLACTLIVCYTCKETILLIVSISNVVS
jgi:hypothetical protein